MKILIKFRVQKTLFLFTSSLFLLLLTASPLQAGEDFGLKLSSSFPGLLENARIPDLENSNPILDLQEEENPIEAAVVVSVHPSSGESESRKKEEKGKEKLIEETQEERKEPSIYRF